MKPKPVCGAGEGLGYPFTEAEAQAAYDEWGCNCGPAALAFALRTKLDGVRMLIPDFDKKRYTSPGMMKAALKNAGIGFMAVTFGTKWQPYLFDDKTALVRVQWTGPWTAPGANPKWAYRQTHWIATWLEKTMRNESSRATMVFDCNGGIRSFDSWEREIVLLLTKHTPRADGGWFPTHIWRLT